MRRLTFVALVLLGGCSEDAVNPTDDGIDPPPILYAVSGSILDGEGAGDSGMQASYVGRMLDVVGAGWKK